MHGILQNIDIEAGVNNGDIIIEDGIVKHPLFHKEGGNYLPYGEDEEHTIQHVIDTLKLYLKAGEEINNNKTLIEKNIAYLESL